MCNGSYAAAWRVFRQGRTGAVARGDAAEGRGAGDRACLGRAHEQRRDAEGQLREDGRVADNLGHSVRVRPARALRHPVRFLVRRPASVHRLQLLLQERQGLVSRHLLPRRGGQVAARRRPQGGDARGRHARRMGRRLAPAHLGLARRAAGRHVPHRQRGVPRRRQGGRGHRLRRLARREGRGRRQGVPDLRRQHVGHAGGAGYRLLDDRGHGPDDQPAGGGRRRHPAVQHLLPPRSGSSSRPGGGSSRATRFRTRSPTCWA